ncbi:shikimate kinase [Mariprofundus erugo]|uniref:shikimate kinase n=1 Tax=Mariprofundus erugo TaxID=2528639 RepID=UPI001EE877C2|nr:shikimate kinase [Mariprofundus erugo]
MSGVVAPVLVGLMGSGKSSIGRRLARALELELIDLDEYIVDKAGMSIPAIFAAEGEEAFRDRETAALREVLGRPAVIATGGGAIMREENRQLLKAHPPVIWLKASPKFLARRIKGDSNRPLIAGGDVRKRLRALAKIRHPLYKECADFILPRADMSKDEAMVAILEFLANWPKRG